VPAQILLCIRETADGRAVVVATAQRHEPGFVGAFYRIDIAEPSTSETRAILDHMARRIERALSIAIDAETIAAALEPTKRFEP
jgi:ATP-dependent Clp protease ATP-binding subunit ClpA